MEQQSWAETFDLPVFIRPDTRFLCDHAEFERWSAGRKSLRMEYFYRDMRKKFAVLMEGRSAGWRSVELRQRQQKIASAQL